MTPKEQEIAINELEERVDRLRNIYEQYFLGFEKLEPTVPRKDVDRRFALLRKEQIRNTAMRFRFQVVTQKYNTYAMHWVRICRQIEEGTYKRHLRKAKARFGDVAQANEADREISIDIDMDDFENTDFDTALQQATAEAESYDRSDTTDTLPPPASVPMPADRAGPLDRGALARQMLMTTPGTSFAIAGRREVLDEMDPNTPPPSVRNAIGERVARSAPLPAGSKPRILRKRDDTEPPPSGKTLPGGPPSSPMIAPASSPRIPPASSPNLPSTNMRRPAPSSPGFDGPGGPERPRIVKRAPGSSPGTNPGVPGTNPGVPGTNPGVPRTNPGVPDTNPGVPATNPGVPPTNPGVPGFSPGAQASGRIPVAAPASSSSAGRMPVAPSVGRVPVAAPAPSAGRLPIAPPGPPQGARPSGGGPAARPAGPPQQRPPGAPGSLPKQPSAPGSSPRAPMPSVPDLDSVPPASVEPRPSVRPRPSLPLPSQLARPKKD